METAQGLGSLFESFGLPVGMLVVLIVGIVLLFRYFTKKDEKHDDEMKEMTEKYYESYIKVTDSYSKVTEALNNNTRVIEKLFDKFEKE